MSDENRYPEALPEGFWELIELGRRNPDQFRSRVKAMTREELIDFYWGYENAAAEVKDDPFVEHMLPDLSEDGIDDVALWLVGQGKERYENVLQNPALTPPDVPDDDDSPEIVEVVVKEYYDRYHDSIPFPDDHT